MKTAVGGSRSSNDAIPYALNGSSLVGVFRLKQTVRGFKFEAQHFCHEQKFREYVENYRFDMTAFVEACDAKENISRTLTMLLHINDCTLYCPMPTQNYKLMMQPRCITFVFHGNNTKKKKQTNTLALACVQDAYYIG